MNTFFKIVEGLRQSMLSLKVFYTEDLPDVKMAANVVLKSLLYRRLTRRKNGQQQVHRHTSGVASSSGVFFSVWSAFSRLFRNLEHMERRFVVLTSSLILFT
jgi:hypothetical protein